MNALRLERRGAHPRRLSGPLIEAALEGVSIGEVCEIRRHWAAAELLARAQVIGFKPDTVVLSLLGEARGLSRESMIVPTGSALRLYCSAEMLGSVVDPRGAIVERLAPAPGFDGREYPVDADPPTYQQRRPVVEPLMTGIRAIDGLLTFGIGQRLGIFASAGSGKTSLLNMLINHTDADVFVIGLIGERGREVTEFIEHLRQSHKPALAVTWPWRLARRRRGEVIQRPYSMPYRVCWSAPASRRGAVSPPVTPYCSRVMTNRTRSPRRFVRFSTGIST